MAKALLVIFAQALLLQAICGQCINTYLGSPAPSCVSSVPIQASYDCVSVQTLPSYEIISSIPSYTLPQYECSVPVPSYNVPSYEIYPPAPTYSVPAPIYSVPAPSYSVPVPVSPSGIVSSVPIGIPSYGSGPISGGSFPTVSSSPLAPSGLSVYSENAIEGLLGVSGSLPFSSAVAVDGAVATAGSAGVNYSCGSSVSLVTDSLPYGGVEVVNLGPSYSVAPAYRVAPAGYTVAAPSAAQYSVGVPSVLYAAPNQGYACGCY